MKLLLIEDNPADARLLREILKQSPAANVTLAHEVRLDSAIAQLRQQTFDLVLLDLGLPDSQGLETVKRMHLAHSTLPIVVLTGLDDQDTALEAVRAGAQDYLVKGRFDADLLTRAIRYAIERKHAVEEIHRLNAELEQRVSERTAQLQAANEELMKEINERKLAEAAQSRSNLKLLEVLDSIQDDFYVLDRDWNFAYVSRQFAAKMGKQVHDLLGQNIWKTFPKFVDSVFEENFRAVMTKRETCRFETAGKYTNAWYRLTVFPSAEGITVLSSDISENRRADEALRQSRKDLDRAQEVGQIGWWRLDTQHNVLTWSDENYRIFGIPKGTPLTYETFLGAIHPDDRDYVDAQWNAGLCGEPYDIEHRIVANRQVKWVREKAYLEFESGGKLLGGFGITQDITERKRAEEQIRERENELRLVMNTVPALISYITPDFYYRRVNERYERWFGLPVHEMEGRHVREIIGEAAWELVCPHLEKALAGETVTYEEHIPYRTSGPRDIVCTLVPYRDQTGRVTGIVAHVTDVSERKKAEEATRRLAQFPTENPNPVLRVAVGGQLIYANSPAHHWLAAWGWQPENPLPDEVLAVTANAIGHSRPMEAEITDPNGITFWLAAVQPAGEIYINLYGRNVTERKRAEAALREREELLRLFVEHAPAAIAMFDRDMTYIAASRRWIADYGLDSRNLLGRSHYQVFPEVTDRWKEIHRHCMSGAVETADEDPFVRADGRTQWLRWEVRPWYAAAGKIGGIIIFTEDITVEKLARAELEQRMQELRVANEELNRFNRVAVNREMRMIELKKEINGLYEQSGQARRYQLDFDENKEQ